MTLRRVLFVAEAVTLAHVGRMYALAQKLDRSKFTPVFAWHPRYNALLGNFSEEFFPLHSISSEQFLERLRTGHAAYDFSTLEVYAAWELEVFREARPDIVVGDFRPSLPTSTQVAGLPYVNVIDAHWSPYARPRFRIPESPTTHFLGAAIPQLVFDVMRPVFFWSFAKDINRLAKKFGRPSFGHDLREMYCQGTRVLYPDLPEITPTLGLPLTHRYLGPLTWSPPQENSAFLDKIPRDLPLVYVSLGTSGQEQLLPLVLDILAQLPVRAVVATGGKIRVQAPSSRIHITDFLPDAQICRVAQLVICNGGVAGAQQALVEGAPVLGLASNLDQFLYMDFAQRAGIGRLVRADTAVRKVLASVIIEMLAAPRYRERCQALATIARSYDGGKILNETLEDALAASPPPLTFTSARTSPRPDPCTAKPIDTPDLAHELAQAALLAPSAGNCQPWRFVWEGDRIDIHLDPMRANPLLDFLNDDLCISLGAVLANMEAIAARRGMGLWADVLPPDARNGLWASVRLTDEPGPEASLAEAVALRHTNRRAYETGPLTSEEKNALKTWTDLPGLRLDLIEGPYALGHAANAMALFNQILIEHAGINQSFRRWLRLSDDKEFSTRDGVGISSLELGFFLRPLFKLIVSRAGAPLVTALGLSSLVRRVSKRVIEKSAAVGIITVAEASEMGFVQAGRAMQRLWLEAARRGLAVQPLAGLLLLDYRLRYASGAGLSVHQRRLVDSARREMADVAPAFLQRVPAMIFRVGRAAPVSARSLRQPLENVFVDKRVGSGTFLPAAAVSNRSSSAIPGPRRSAPRRVLFVGEAVTVTHVGRVFRLASQIDRSRFTPLLAWHPRYNHLLGALTDDFYPLFSIDTAEFVRKLHDGKPIYDFDTLERYVSWDLEVLRAARPDVVVGDYRLSLATSAQFAGIPYVNIINAHWSTYARPQFRVPESPVVQRLGVAIPQLVFDVARPFFFRMYANDFNRLNEKFGRPSFGSDLRSIYSYGDRVLYPDMAEIVPTPGLPLTHRYLGPVVWSPDLPVPPELDQRDPRQKTVYVNMGTSGNAALVPCIVQSLLARKLRVIAAIGKQQLPIAPAPGLFTTDYISGDAACRVADLVIFNGGSAGGHQAMLAGVPVIGIASNLDQFLNMHFVEKAGLGITVRADQVTRTRIGLAVDAILDDSRYAERCRTMAERAQTYQAAHVLEETLEDVLGGRPALAPPPLVAAPLSTMQCPIAVVRRIVQAGILAPTVGNSQPFRFCWDGERLAVHVVPDRANPFLNFYNPDTWLGLGTTLANLRFSAAAQGYPLQVQLTLAGAKDGLVAYLFFASDASLGEDLSDQIEARCTNRLPYNLKPVSADVLDSLTRSISAYSSVRIDWVTDPVHQQKMTKAMTIYNRLLFENQGLLSSFLPWLRRSKKEAEASRDGLSIDSLELGGLGERLFLLSASTWRAKLLAPLGLFRIFAWGSARRTGRSAAFAMISIPLNDVATLVQGGSALETLWLKATQLGLAFQPIAGPLMLMSRVRSMGGAGFKPYQQRLTYRTMAALGRIIPAFETRIPVCFVRIGYAPPPSARSLRLSQADIFEDKSKEKNESLKASTLGTY